ncbi:hypothetical protein MalM25_13980 [Planctomycetes bacterium MalM25]|nr:hypothetical protein MalM25_13980 [Planctomycetes bacterium MalM25]
MAVGGLFKYARRALFSKPTPERQLLKALKQQPIRRVVELGVDSEEATVTLLQALAKQAGGEPIEYTAIDPFEVRPADQEALPLAGYYRQLVATGARVRLKPGEVAPGVAAHANSLADTDLLLLSRRTTDADLGPSWFYVPRMCHPGTLVFRRHEGETAEQPGEWRPITLEEVSSQAGAVVRSRAA